MVGDHGVALQRCLNLPALLSAQCRELKSVLGSQYTNDSCRDRLFIGAGQRDFERNQLARHESFGNKRPQAAFAEIRAPSPAG